MGAMNDQTVNLYLKLKKLTADENKKHYKESRHCIISDLKGYFGNMTILLDPKYVNSWFQSNSTNIKMRKIKYVLSIREDSAVCMPNMNTLVYKLSKIIFDDRDSILLILQNSVHNNLKSFSTVVALC